MTQDQKPEYSQEVLEGVMASLLESKKDLLRSRIANPRLTTMEKEEARRELADMEEKERTKS